MLYKCTYCVFTLFNRIMSTDRIVHVVSSCLNVYILNVPQTTSQRDMLRTFWKRKQKVKFLFLLVAIKSFLRIAIWWYSTRCSTRGNYYKNKQKQKQSKVHQLNVLSSWTLPNFPQVEMWDTRTINTKSSMKIKTKHKRRKYHSFRFSGLYQTAGLTAGNTSIKILNKAI